jgi:3-hydroxybutyryl-CoA dehydrogenase
MRVAIVGAGLMGAQIGCEYALGGHDVTLIARDAAAAERRVESALRLVEELALGETAPARERLRVATGPVSAVGCDLAVESVPEDLELKARLLREVASGSPEAVLASNTSSIPITALGEAVGAPERVLGTHYLNPPLLMPPVELVAGERTDPTLLVTMTETLQALGKQPVLVRRDVPGFVWNRLQFALLRECVALVDEGVASAEDVDRVVRDGLARRWRRVGPFAAIGLGGVETWNRAGANLVPEISTATSLGDLSRFVSADAEEQERLRATRDAALAEELRAERA